MRFKKRFLIFILVTALIFSSNIITEGAQFKITPYLSVSEEYTDNFFLDKDNKIEEYITRFTPFVLIENISSRWPGYLFYAFDYRYYANNSLSDEATHYLDARTNVEIMKEHFFLKLTDMYRRKSLDTARDFTLESIAVNQSDANELRINPYFRITPGAFINIITGYEYVNFWYRETGAVDKTDNSAFINMDYKILPSTTLRTGYSYFKENSALLDFSRSDVYFGADSSFLKNTVLSFRVGNSFLDFKEERETSQFFWDIDLSQKFQIFTVLLESRQFFLENPSGEPQRERLHSINIIRGERLYEEHARYERFAPEEEAVIPIEPERLNSTLSFYLADFADLMTKDLNTRKYGASIIAAYDFTKKTKGTVGFTAEKYEVKLANTYERKYIADTKLEYRLTENLFASLGYRYIDSDSPKLLDRIYKNNRFTVDVTKRF